MPPRIDLTGVAPTNFTDLTNDAVYRPAHRFARPFTVYAMYVPGVNLRSFVVRKYDSVYCDSLEVLIVSISLPYAHAKPMSTPPNTIP